MSNGDPIYRYVLEKRISLHGMVKKKGIRSIGAVVSAHDDGPCSSLLKTVGG